MRPVRKRPTATELLVFWAQHARDGTKRAVFIAACAHGAELAAHFFERHALNQDVAGTGQSRQEQSLATEQRGLDAAHELDIIDYGHIEGHDAAGVHLEGLARLEVKFNEIAASMDEHGAWSCELFQDKPLTSEESGPEALHEPTLNPTDVSANRKASRWARIVWPGFKVNTWIRPG